MESVQIPGVDPQAVRVNKLNLVERLADDLAHEIKNPLHSMVINLEVLKRRIARTPGGDPADLMRYVGVLAGELDRVNRRVDLLLRMVRPDRGGDPVSLTSVLEELLELLELERDRRGAAVEYEPGAQLVRGRVPRDAARQLLLNLLLVGLERAGAGGVLRVTSEADASHERVRLTAAPANGGEPREDSGDDEKGSCFSIDMIRAVASTYGGQLDVGALDGTPGATEFVFSVALDG